MTGISLGILGICKYNFKGLTRNKEPLFFVFTLFLDVHNSTVPTNLLDKAHFHVVHSLAGLHRTDLMVNGALGNARPRNENIDYKLESHNQMQNQTGPNEKLVIFHEISVFGYFF